MTDEKKPLKIEFVPGCFDNFEGTQEELDNFIKEITTMFTELTPEELESRSRQLSEAEIDELPPEMLAQLAEHFFDEKELTDLENLGMPRKRKLQ